MIEIVKLLIRQMVTILLAFLSVNIGNAADIYPDDKYPNFYSRIYLVGEIREGDAERLASLLATTNKILPSFIYIDSKGGDLFEAMKIAQLVKDFHLNVKVKQGGYCVSACFFIFLSAEQRLSGAGVNEDGTLKSQEKRNRWLGVVGIHRPYFKKNLGTIDSPKRQEVMMSQVKEFLTAENLPQYIIDEMMSRPSNDVYWLRERDLEAIGEYSAGVEELLINKCGYKRFSKIYDEKWSEEKIAALDYCTIGALESINAPLKNAYNKKLRSGWRPWQKS